MRTFAAIIIYRNNDGTTDNGIFPKTISYDLETETAKVFTLWGEAKEVIVKNVIDIIPLKVSGRTYQERRADLEEKAIIWSNAGAAAAWSYGELAEIEDFFRTNGKRYGLLKEFEENAIC